MAKTLQVDRLTRRRGMAATGQRTLTHADPLCLAGSLPVGFGASFHWRPPPPAKLTGEAVASGPAPVQGSTGRLTWPLAKRRRQTPRTKCSAWRVGERISTSRIVNLRSRPPATCVIRRPLNSGACTTAVSRESSVPLRTSATTQGRNRAGQRGSRTSRLSRILSHSSAVGLRRLRAVALQASSRKRNLSVQVDPGARRKSRAGCFPGRRAAAPSPPPAGCGIRPGRGKLWQEHPRLPGGRDPGDGVVAGSPR